MSCVAWCLALIQPNTDSVGALFFDYLKGKKMDVIKFLESVGSVPMFDGEYLDAVQSLAIDSEQRVALLSRDGDQLGKLLGGRNIMYCSVLAPDHEDAPNFPDEPADEPEPEPDQVR
jgi:hypothetical protein